MTPSVLVIAQRGDVGAVALATLLRRRRAARVTLLDAAAFAGSPVTLHPESGPPTSASGSAPPWHRDRAPGGGDREVDVIYCRAAGFDAPRFARPGDAEYALAEMQAFGLSWLWTRRELVVNRPTPQALCGAVPDMLVTAQACSRVGLRTPDILMTTDAARVPRDRTPHPPRLWPEPVVPHDPDELAPRGVGPPLAVPGAWVEPVGPDRRRVVVAGDETDAPPAVAERIVTLVWLLGLEVAEVRLATDVRPDADPLVLSVAPVPSPVGVSQTALLARYLERRATEHEGRAAR